MNDTELLLVLGTVGVVASFVVANVVGNLIVKVAELLGSTTWEE